MKVRVLSEAETEACAAADWYWVHNREQALKFVDAYEAALAEIEQDAERFPLLETVAPEFNVRRVKFKKFPHLMIFRISSDEVVVGAVAHPARDPEYWKARLGIP